MKPGDRVRLMAPSPTLTLRSDLGTIVGPDPENGDLGCYIVRLDRPARYGHDADAVDLDEIREMDDNMIVV